MLGSVLSGGDSLPKPNAPATWVATVRPLSEPGAVDPPGDPDPLRRRRRARSRQRQGRDVFPHNIGLGCTREPAIEAAARVTAREMAGTGIDWTFAPCIAVARDERWGRTYESFGETPELAESLGAAAIRGFEQATDGTAILATAKHFLADGGTLGRQGSRRRPDQRGGSAPLHLPGYAAASRPASARDGVVLELEWPAMHGNRRLITDLLKGELGFGGFVVTDWQAIDRMAPGDYARRSTSRSTPASTW